MGCARYRSTGTEASQGADARHFGVRACRSGPGSIRLEPAITGRPRTVPVLAVDVPGGWGLVASSFGQERHPGWYHNLRANPKAVLEVQGKRIDVVARQVHGTERDDVREAALRIYPGSPSMRTVPAIGTWATSS